MKLPRLIALAATAWLLISGPRCSEAVSDEIFGAPLFGAGDAPRVVNSTPVTGSVGVTRNQVLTLEFKKPLNSAKCSAAFSLTPNVTGYGRVFGNYFLFSPNTLLSEQSYVMTMSKDCEDAEGRDLLDAFYAEFAVGFQIPAETPAVQAVGLASQNCPAAFPAGGSSVGGDHTLGSCWWDNNLAILTASNYRFRGGDDGSGAGACADVNTDNIVVIFNRYMDINATIAAISLTRQSPPISSIRLASWTWSDCRANAPYGCRAVTLVFSEDRSSCNGASAFGTDDFNLERSNAPSTPGSPLYLLEIDTTARDAEETTLTNTFNFGIEGD